MAGRVEGKIAIVTGGTKGLGKADAEALAREGASVVITDIDDAGKGVAETIAAATGATVVFKHQDVTSEQRWQELVAEVEKEFGGIDILVNNAGIVIVATPEQTTLEDFRLQNAVMNEGVFLGCKTVIPAMRKRGGGSIICISSVSAQRGGGIFGGPHYSAAKAGILGLMRAMARELGPDGIRVNAVTPGLIETDITGGLLTEARKAEINKTIPLGRLGRPKDVADICLFLASDLSAYVTGATIDVNGGMHIH